MQIIDYLVLSAILISVIAAIAFMIRQKKSGKRTGCGACSGKCAECTGKQKER